MITAIPAGALAGVPHYPLPQTLVMTACRSRRVP
jgi:hypothetical protein